MRGFDPLTHNAAVIEIQVGTADLARIRFAHDVVWETAASLNAVAFPHAHLLHARLRRRISRHPGFDLAYLMTLTANRGWIPDLLCPAPSDSLGTPEERLAGLAGADLAVAESDLRKLRELRPDCTAARMSPVEYLETTATELTAYWREVLLPLWDRVESIASADIAHHRAVLAGQGLSGALPGVHDELSFTDGTIQVAMGSEAVVRASGRGLWFAPSVFRWPWLAVDIREHEPVVSYAARGAGRVWEEPRNTDLGLVELLGRSRAEILQRLDIARTTTGLAREIDLSPSTVNWHLSVMTTAGLLASRREGRRVLYARTLVGDLLIRGDSALSRLP